MPQFTYKAKKDDGSVVTGTLQAESARSALDSLGRMGVFPLEIESRSEDKPGTVRRTTIKQTHGTVKAGDIAIFTRQMSDLMKAGVPLNRALHTLATQTTNLTLSEIISEIEKQVSGGATLHDALARFPKQFSTLYVSMVHAGRPAASSKRCSSASPSSSRRTRSCGAASARRWPTRSCSS
jgi:type II secretory pathway component PulF